MPVGYPCGYGRAMTTPSVPAAHRVGDLDYWLRHARADLDAHAERIVEALRVGAPVDRDALLTLGILSARVGDLEDSRCRVLRELSHEGYPAVV